jgi:hypothetical protein
MVKTTVYLEESTKDRLAMAAARRHTSEADLIREAIDRLLKKEPPVRPPRLGIFDSGDVTLAERTDELLDEGLGRDGVDW